jgi:hypothetical protein
MRLVSAHAAPIMLAKDGRRSVLTRVLLGSGQHDSGEREAFIQTLVHQQPEVIPMADLAPPFMPLVTNMRSCGIQPAHQSLINRRLEAFASGYAQANIEQPPLRNGLLRPSHLKMDMRITTLRSRQPFMGPGP